MNVKDLILAVAGQAFEIIEKHGHMPAGHNGPYHHPETEVRNNGHWLITFGHAYRWTRQERFLEAARKCSAVLLNLEARPHGATFHHRKMAGKNSCNGLIGQAWTIESLVEAARLFGDESYMKLAEEVFFLLPFSKESGLWKIREIDNQVHQHDSAFNHQLWLAACASLLDGQQKEEVRKRLEVFLSMATCNLTVLSSGLLYHPIEFLLEAKLKKYFSAKTQARRWLNEIKKSLRSFKLPTNIQIESKRRDQIAEQQEYKSVGYQAFNLFAFGMLKESFPENDLWSTPQMAAMLDYLQSKEYLAALDLNKYGYPYNPPGFEVPYALYCLTDLSPEKLKDTAQWWLQQQVDRCFEAESKAFSRNNSDPVTQTARIYELCRWPEFLLDSVEVKNA
jgi:hypothetical protein